MHLPLNTEKEERRVHETFVERMNHSSISTYLKRLVLTIVTKDANCRPSIADIKAVLCFVENGEHGKLDSLLKPMITSQDSLPMITIGDILNERNKCI